MERDGIPYAALSSDTEFFRRIHLDLTGRIPDSEEVRRFVASEDPEKRDKLIEKLIGSKLISSAGRIGSQTWPAPAAAV